MSNYHLQEGPDGQFRVRVGNGASTHGPFESRSDAFRFCAEIEQVDPADPALAKRTHYHEWQGDCPAGCGHTLRIVQQDGRHYQRCENLQCPTRHSQPVP
jgi:hypothetical protein